jgi:hypothetical protein
MKRINPLLTANNPAPIPGCHAPVKAIAHSAVVNLTSPILEHEGLPLCMNTDVLESKLAGN